MSTSPAAATPPPPVSPGLARAQRIARHLALPILIFFAWELLTRYGIIKPIFLPPPAKVAEAFYYLFAKDNFLDDLRISATTVAQGFTVGAVIGLLAGFACGLSRTVEEFLGPTLNTIRQVPTLAWLPLIILWFGAGDTGKIVIIGKGVFFPVFLNTLQGIRGTSREHIEVGRIFAYSRLRLLWRIVLPAALPSIFVGLRYGAGLAWAFIIFAEMLGARRGIGFVLMRAQELMHSDQLFVLIIIIGGIGFAIDAGLRGIEKYLLRWKRGYEG